MKTRKQTIIISAVVLIAYNLIALLMPSIKGTTFWVAYGFSNLAIVVSSLVVLSALDSERLKNKFQGMPLVYTAWMYLLVQIVLGFVEIYYPIHFRQAILINSILLGIIIIRFAIASAGKNEIERVEKKTQEKVFFIKEIQSDVEIFAEKIEDEETKKEIMALAQTVKYSDPMTHSQLAGVENQINIKVSNLTKEINNNDNIKQICNEVQQLFAERNKKAKLYKGQPDTATNEQKPLNLKGIIAGIIIVIVLIALGVTAYYTMIIPNKEYDEAMRLLNNKQYLRAEEAFKKLENYKDSEEKLNEVIYEYGLELYNNGDYENAIGKFLRLDNYKDSRSKVAEICSLFADTEYIYFGTYNGVAIGWQIVEVTEDKALLVANDTIGEMAYNKELKTVDFKNSTIKKWLNQEFYKYFDEKEKAKILKDEKTKDSVFLLSNEDIEKYKDLKTINTSWWLVTKGEESTKAMFVEENGKVNTSGDTVTRNHGVRPAIWLNLK